MKVNDAAVKRVGNFIYLGSEMNSEWKFDGEINRRTKKEVLGRTNHLLSLIRHGPH
jgi:hypothetical protein